jgi:hypothetical protein
MAVASQTDLVIENMPLESGLDEVVTRLVRDLELCSALCTSETVGRRQLLAWAGGDPVPFLRSIRAVTLLHHGRCSQVTTTSGTLHASGIGAYVAAPISAEDGRPVGALWAAASCRRWFDHDEIHHLGLLARRAAGLLRSNVVIGLTERTEPVFERVLSLR